MIKEAEEFAAEDELQRKRIEALNSLSSFVYGLKNQLGDQEGLGRKISDDDKKTILSTIKETTEWIDEHGQNASVEDLEEKLSGVYLRLWKWTSVDFYVFAEVQGVVSPITTKLYSGGAKTGSDDDVPDDIHDELWANGRLGGDFVV